VHPDFAGSVALGFLNGLHDLLFLFFGDLVFHFFKLLAAGGATSCKLQAASFLGAAAYRLHVLVKIPSIYWRHASVCHTSLP
jgi:hypothetical protein